MDYSDLLLNERSKPAIDRIVKAIGADTQEFKKIIDLIYTAEAPLPQHASWVLTAIAPKQPQLLTPYVTKFIDTVESFSHSGIRRHILRALTTQKIPKNKQGKLVNTCFNAILDPEEPVAVKVFALQNLANIAQQYPELQEEIKAAIEDQLPKTSVAFHSRAKKVLKKFGR